MFLSACRAPFAAPPLLGLRWLFRAHTSPLPFPPAEEKLQDRLQALRGTQEEPSGGAPGRPPSQAPLWTQLGAEAKELRREKEELHQQVALLTGVLRETEAENQEQRGRVGRLVQDVAALKRCSEELQCQAWQASQEANGLRQELEQVQGLLQETRQARQELEARWMQEKALEAERLNRANEREEKYRQKVIRLREQLQEAVGLLQPCCKCKLNLPPCHWLSNRVAADPAMQVYTPVLAVEGDPRPDRSSPCSCPAKPATS